VAIIVGEANAKQAHIAEDEADPLVSAVRLRLRAGGMITAKEYIEALDAQRRAKAAFAEAMDGFSALVLPTLPMAAIPVADVDQSRTPADITRMANVLGLRSEERRVGKECRYLSSP